MKHCKVCQENDIKVVSRAAAYTRARAESSLWRNLPRNALHCVKIRLRKPKLMTQALVEAFGHEGVRTYFSSCPQLQGPYHVCVCSESKSMNVQQLERCRRLPPVYRDRDSVTSRYITRQSLGVTLRPSPAQELAQELAARTDVRRESSRCALFQHSLMVIHCNPPMYLCPRDYPALFW